MKIKSKTKGNALIVEIHDKDIDIYTAGKLKDALFKESEKNFDYIILDMKKIHYIDSSGLGILISYLNSIKKEKRELKLANCDKKLLSILETTRLTKVFSIFDSVESAMK